MFEQDGRINHAKRPFIGGAVPGDADADDVQRFDRWDALDRVKQLVAKYGLSADEVFPESRTETV